MTLKALRADLTAHLAQGLNASAPKIGQLVNPPAVIVQAGSPYVTASTYCEDAVLFDATIVAPPGDPAAVVDALDDMIDEVRSTLKTVSSGGNRFGFVEISGFTTLPNGDETLPAVVVSVSIQRVT